MTGCHPRIKSEDMLSGSTLEPRRAMGRVHHRLWPLVAAMLAGAGGAFAQALEPPREIRAGCVSATDGCRVCKIDDKGELVGCSFPGITCAPVAWQCNGRGWEPGEPPKGDHEEHASPLEPQPPP
ncbi:MAG: hypothetical protein AB7S70_10180 [Hyphomicrobium sp.]|uniref:hypothetical protein n=1 Tax=Hyphomicrobium sp. TaxID=82 RepID=UPI003D12A901